MNGLDSLFRCGTTPPLQITTSSDQFSLVQLNFECLLSYFQCKMSVGQVSWRRDEYAIAIICATSFEMNAIRHILDSEHSRPQKEPGDPNLYIVGEVGRHNVVIACPAATQESGAATIVSQNLARTFPVIQWRFLAGIGGGIPTAKHDIRLGDVVVSRPRRTHGGFMQHRIGLTNPKDDLPIASFLRSPPTILRSAIEAMRSDRPEADNRIGTFLKQLLKRSQHHQQQQQQPQKEDKKGGGLSNSHNPPAEQDVLFESDNTHTPGQAECVGCDSTKAITRPNRPSNVPTIHYGTIASGPSALDCATVRGNFNTQSSTEDVLCFETEANGILSTNTSYVVIRGIANYADTHHYTNWNRYAAAAAAACTKELLSYLDPPSLPHRFVLENRIDDELHIKEAEEPSTFTGLKVGESREMRSAIIRIRISNSDLSGLAWTAPFHISRTGSEYIKIETPSDGIKLAQIETWFDDDTAVTRVLLETRVWKWPYSIVNRSDEEYAFWQNRPSSNDVESAGLNWRLIKHTIQPFGTCLYAWDYTTVRSRRLVVEILGKQLLVDLNQPGPVAPPFIKNTSSGEVKIFRGTVEAGDTRLSFGIDLVSDTANTHSGVSTRESQVSKGRLWLKEMRKGPNLLKDEVYVAHAGLEDAQAIAMLTARRVLCLSSEGSKTGTFYDYQRSKVKVSCKWNIAFDQVQTFFKDPTGKIVIQSRDDDSTSAGSSRDLREISIPSLLSRHYFEVVLQVLVEEDGKRQHKSEKVYEDTTKRS